MDGQGWYNYLQLMISDGVLCALGGIGKTVLQSDSFFDLSFSLGKMSPFLLCELRLLWVSQRKLVLSLQLLAWLEPLTWLELLRLLKLLRLLELLRLLDGLSPPGVKVWSLWLLLWVELRSWLLLELLSRSHSVEVCGRLVPGNLLESVSLLELLPSSEDLQPPLSLLLLSKSLPLLSNSGLFLGLGLPDQLVRDDLGQSFQIQLEEHIEGVFLSVFREAGELRLAEVLQLGAECQVLPVKLLLLVSGESLPRSGV